MPGPLAPPAAVLPQAVTAAVASLCKTARLVEWRGVLTRRHAAGTLGAPQHRENTLDYTTLGRTGLRVSVAGLGCGGNSRIGLGRGRSEAESIALVHEALDLGVNFFDTAAAYGTEELLGKALKAAPREKVVVATKAMFGRLTPERAVASLDRSLRQLDTDYIDVFQLHGVSPDAYEPAFAEIVPALLRERDKGKFRFLGITETSPGDPEHEMVRRAVADGVWDTVMLGFHMMHQNARQKVYPLTREHRIGTLQMFVVRNIFSQPERLAAALRQLVAEGELPQELAEDDDPLGFLVHDSGASSVTDAAYRFVRHEPGVDVVLFGTGNPEHLRSNIASILKPPLPQIDRDRLGELFGHLVGVGLDPPDMSQRR
jgi:aryl-alcohol dehydrogenase-like predicted oxidoreductase